MARKYRLEYLKRKKAKEKARVLKAEQNEALKKQKLEEVANLQKKRNRIFGKKCLDGFCILLL